MEEYNPKDLKSRAVTQLNDTLTIAMQSQLADIDGQLQDYFTEMAAHPEWHNLYEVLGGLRFLRILRAYDFDHETVRKVITLFEGEWRQEDGRWQYLSGGVKFDSLDGFTHYRLQPFQVFMLAYIYGPQRDNGRRLVNQFIAYLARKGAKTMFAGFIGAVDFLIGDANAEVYCMANSQQQAKRVFKECVNILTQLDPKGQYFRITQTECNWKRNMPRTATLTLLSAGGKAKDGPMSSTNLIDEYGSSPYVNGHSDMGNLVEVMKSSQGPRRNPLNLITTTAGNIMAGPFPVLLENLKKELQDEVGDIADKTDGDFQGCLLLEPDEWLREEDVLFTNPDVLRQVQPMLGISVQDDYYARQIAASRRDPETKRETINKLFNIYQSAKTEKWLKPDDIRALQIPQRIDDLSGYDGWLSTCGFDFSMGDDIYAASYLCVRRQDDGSTEFFADMTCWVSEEAMKESPLRPLYEKWAAEGWLNVVPGWTFQTTLFLDRISEILEHVPVLGFGYDPYRANQPINDLTAFVTAAGADAKATIIPIRQNYATYNPLVLELDAMVRSNPPLLHFSPNPIWPWVFGNVALSVSNDGMENRKPVKSSESKTCKVDPVQALCNALAVFDILDGRVSK